MKQKIVFSSFLILFINSFLCDKISAQYLDPVINPYLEYYSTNILSSISAGKGNTGVASSGDVSLIYLNPATLNISKKVQVNAGYNLKSESRDKLSQNFYSFSLAGAYRLNKNFQAGFAYQNDYSYKYTQSTYIPEDNALIQTFETHSIRIPVVFEYKWMRIGLNMNLTYFNGHAKYQHGNLWKFIPEIGTVVTPDKQFSIGASFIPGFTSDINSESNSSFYPAYKTYVKFPNRIKIGTEFRSSNNDTKFTLDYHYTNTSTIEGFKDRNDIHFGFENLLDENWAFRCGFFSNSKGYDNNIYFLTFGTSFKYINYSFNLAGLVSMAGNSGSGEYYVLNFGAGYEF